MGSGKDKIKAAAGLEIMASMVQKAVQRWTAKSPKAYRIITDVSAGAAIAATLIMFIPVTWPAWVVPTAAVTLAITSKLTVDNKDKPNNP